jgi:hypothetical protein
MAIADCDNCPFSRQACVLFYMKLFNSTDLPLSAGNDNGECPIFSTIASAIDTDDYNDLVDKHNNLMKKHTELVKQFETFVKEITPIVKSHNDLVNSYNALIKALGVTEEASLESLRKKIEKIKEAEPLIVHGDYVTGEKLEVKDSVVSRSKLKEGRRNIENLDIQDQ